MNRPKVSVIMPVYNTAPYLNESIGSILNQTLEDLELWIVDDGSTDNSLEIIKEFAGKDDRVHWISQENKGLSCARNTGYNKACGEYLYFMDSDDILDNDCFEKCHIRCKLDLLDFVCFDAKNIIEDDCINIIQEYNRAKVINYNKIYKGSELLYLELNNYVYKSPVWLNFIKMSYIRGWFEGFYPGIIHEDHLFTFFLYLNSNRCGYIDRCFFNRRVRNNSIMGHRFSYKNIVGYKKTINELLIFRNSNFEFIHIVDKYIDQTLNAVVWQSYTLSFRNKLKLIYWIVKNKLIKYVKMYNLIVCIIKRKK